jgi:hypothetical protein
MMDHIDLDTITLQKGSHSRRGRNSVCAMEAVAWLAREPHTDSPKCASEVIGAFMRSWNDALDDDTRQQLKPYLPRLVGTAASREVEERRAWMATDWLIRTCEVAFLRLAKLDEYADAIAALPEIDSPESARAAQPVLDAAGVAAWVAAGDAAWVAARDAAGAAAGSARDAAWVAAGDAARAARAAGAAARDAARAARVAGAALQPTVGFLQASAFGLLDRMIEC